MNIIELTEEDLANGYEILDSEDEIIGQTDFELYPDDQAGSALKEDQFVLRTGNPILDIDGKLTDKDGIAVLARFEEINTETGRLTVTIQDSGPGIPDSDLKKLFKRFEQTSAGINKSSGTGLGSCSEPRTGYFNGWQYHRSKSGWERLKYSR